MEKETIVLRHRDTKLSKVKKIDFFPKIEDTYKEHSTIGGTLTIVSFVLIAWLLYSEISYYLDSKFIFKFSPDADFDTKLKINVDLTVAMPCANLGADILDSTNQNAFKFGQLEEEDTWFDLDQRQRSYFDNKQSLNYYLREEYHSVKDLLWKRSFSHVFSDMPKRAVEPKRPPDACRFYGTLVLNKVAGNFHITAGRSIHLPKGHIHISAFMSENDHNFTHRINRLSFGDPSPGIIHPLEGEEHVATGNMILYQYFIEVVPTSVKTFLRNIETYQYSAKHLARPIDHSKGSHGMPGIYLKYDVSALKVTISQEHDNLAMFLAKLCSIVGGIFVCSGIISSIIQLLSDLIFCSLGKNVDGKVEKDQRQSTIILYIVIILIIFSLCLLYSHFLHKNKYPVAKK